tara:strand:+ start:3825 stop:4697 length:873 start_codon:yes stop_codon:yes gene_type:complete
MSVATAAMIGLQLFGAISAKSAADDAAERAIEIGTANAADLREISAKNADEIRRIAGLNAGAILSTANLNAGSVLNIATANSLAHLDSTITNLDLAATENLELLRRHVLQERALAGSIRAATGASGVRVGQGSPLEVLVDAVEQGYGERQYMANYARKRLTMMGKEGITRAKLTMLDAEERSRVLLETAALQAHITREEAESSATIMLNDAEANAKSMERGGAAYAASMRAQGTASLISGLMGATNTYLQYGGGGFSSGPTLSPSATHGFGGTGMSLSMPYTHASGVGVG